MKSNAEKLEDYLKIAALNGTYDRERYMLDAENDKVRLLGVDRQFEGILVIPDFVSVITDAAAFNCKGIASVITGKGLRIIGSRAFYDCKNLESIELQEGLEEIWGRSFRHCWNLKNFIVPESVRIFQFDMATLSNDLETFKLGHNIENMTDIYYYQIADINNIIIPRKYKDYIKNEPKDSKIQWV